MGDGLTEGGTRSFLRTFCPREDSLAFKLCRDIDVAMAQAVKHRRDYVVSLEASLRVLIDSIFHLSWVVGDLSDDPPRVAMSPTSSALYILHPLPLHGSDKAPGVFMTQSVVSACLMACVEAASISFAPLYWFLCTYAAEVICVPPSAGDSRSEEAKGKAPFHRLSSTQDHQAILAKCNDAMRIVNVARLCLRWHPDVRRPTLASMDPDTKSPVSPFLRYAGAITEALSSVAAATRAFAEFGESWAISVCAVNKSRKFYLRITEFECLCALIGVLRREAEREIPISLHADTDRRLRAVFSDIKLAFKISVVLLSFATTNDTIYSQTVDEVREMGDSPRAVAFLRLLTRFEKPKESAARLEIKQIAIKIPPATGNGKADLEPIPFDDVDTEERRDGYFASGLVSYDDVSL